jgi:hypothetical protein
MENKLRKEQLNRQDKVRKAGDYRETFVQESLARSSTSHIERFKENLEFKDALIDCYSVSYYWIGNHFIHLDWNLEKFATRNKLNSADPKTLRLFESMQLIAGEDFRSIVLAIRNGKVVWDHNDQGDYKPNIEIKPSLRCDVFPLKEENQFPVKRLLAQSRAI